MNKELAKAILRIVVLAITGINGILVAKGISPIPFDESAFYEVVSYIATGVAALWAWWKNNNVTKKAQVAQGYKSALNDGVIFGDVKDEEEFQG